MKSEMHNLKTTLKIFKVKLISIFRFLSYKKTIRFLNLVSSILKNILLLTATIVTIFSGILTFQNYDSFKAWFLKEFKTKDYYLNAAETLSPEVNINVFKEKLGTPIFTSKNEKGLTNITFINDYFYTQAITDDTDRVVLYSITLRKGNFYPRVPYILDDKYSVHFRLGIDSYEDISLDGLGMVGLQYLPSYRRYIYSEAYYHGNPGNYLYYIFTTNDAGLASAGYEFPDFSHSITFKESGLFKGCDNEFFPNHLSMDLDKTKVDINNYLPARETRPNTFTITERSGIFMCENKDSFDELILLGPDLDKVRLYQESSKRMK
jgi:hypothetical protein